MLLAWISDRRSAVTTAEGIAAFTPLQQRALRALKRTHFVKLIAAQQPDA